MFVCLFVLYLVSLSHQDIRHTGVVKLAGLANGKTTGADDKHLLDVDMVAGLDNAALDISLRVGGGLAGSSRGSGGREPPLLGGQPLGGVGLCLEDGGILGAGGESPQLGRLDGNPPTMAEESRSSASLVHGRQHYVQWGEGVCSSGGGVWGRGKCGDGGEGQGYEEGVGGCGRGEGEGECGGVEGFEGLVYLDISSYILSRTYVVSILI